jgi:porin
MPLPAAKPWQPLADRGLTLLLNYTGEAAANPVGGIRQDGAYAGQVFMGGNFDLDRMAAIPGAVLRAWVTNRHGDNLSAIAIGNNTSVQEIFGTQNTHLAVLTWQQKLLDEHLELEGGRTVANINFLSSPIYCNFQSNSTCGNPTFVFKTSNFTYFPASSWGAHARGWFTKSLYLHAGVYEVNPDRKRASDDGFNFSVRNATGVIAPFEVGYSTTFATDRLPRNYRLGGWYDAGDYSDPLKDEQGGLAILTGQPYATHNGRSGAFVRFDQMLWRPSDKTDRGLTVFGVAMLRVSGRVNEDYFLELGLLEKGTFRGRDEDTIGFMINDQKMSGLALENIRAARVAAGGSATLPSHQLMMELAYGAQLGPALRLSPNLQYIVNPDQMSVPSRTSDIPNAFVTGFKFTIDAPSLLSAPDG